MTEHNTSSSYLKLSGSKGVRRLHRPEKAIDLEISQGEFVCFLGPSGCGKTTLLRIIAGLETPRQAASSKVVGTSPRHHRRRDYGIVFQLRAVPQSHGRRQRGLRHWSAEDSACAKFQRHVEELVKLVGLPGSERKFPGPALWRPAATYCPRPRAGDLARPPAACVSRSLRWMRHRACPATAGKSGRCSRRSASPPSW